MVGIYKVLYCLLGFVAITFILSACADRVKKNQTSLVEKAQTDVNESFPLPDIPVTLASNEERMRYFLQHYWDLYDFTDTIPVYKQETIEQALVNYLSLLAEEEENDRMESLKNFVKNLSVDETAGIWFQEKIEHYLYDPNSPMRNDDWYRTVIQEIVASVSPDDYRVERMRYQLKMLNTNVKGSRAADFSFRLSAGGVKSLWNIQSNYTLLLLYDPECENCHKAIETLIASPELGNMMESSGKGIPLLAILTVAVEGEKEDWEKHLSYMPENWLNGYDEKGSIRERELYDLRSVPSMYLLDKSKKVLIRDANAPEIMNYLLTAGSEK